VVIEPADVADLSNLSLGAVTELGQATSADMSNPRSAADESSQGIEPNDIPIYTTKELLLILQYSKSLVDNRKREVPLVPVRQETPASMVALITR
jgi:hypothetical protein